LPAPYFTARNIIGTSYTATIPTGATLQLGCGNATGTTSAILAGAGGLKKIGTGVITLTATNTYTGNTAITGGTLQIGDCITGSLGGGTYAGDITNSGTLIINTPADQILSGVISGAGTLTKLCTSTAIFTAANTYTGTTTITAGTMQIGNGGTTGSIANTASIVNTANLAFNRSDDITFSKIISGAGSLIQKGSGSLNLPVANTYTGETDINNGILRVSNVSAIGDVGSITFTGGILQYSNNNQVDYSGRFSIIGNQAIDIDLWGQNIIYSSPIIGNNTSLSVRNFSSPSFQAEYLIVGAGASGGAGTNTSNYSAGGGGGAGTVVAGNINLSANSYSITIGVGGTAVSGNTDGNNGNNSVFNGITAFGGAGGGGYNRAGKNGNGNAGGGGGPSGANGQRAGGTSLSGWNNGGRGLSVTYSQCGGGGGAGSSPLNAGWGPERSGGSGIASSITGVNTNYGAGGMGGLGFQVNTSGASGAANTGNGGGGSGRGGNSGAGGSGIVVIAYKDIYPDLIIDAGLTFTRDVATRAGYKVYKFTAGAGDIKIPGTLTLSGDNTYDGITHIYRGAVIVDNSSALGTNDVIIEDGGSLTLNTNLTTTQTITVNVGATFNKNGKTFSGVIVNNGGTIIN
jgi:autotransporter-associated beta strand protein